MSRSTQVGVPVVTSEPSTAENQQVVVAPVVRPRRAAQQAAHAPVVEPAVEPAVEPSVEPSPEPAPESAREVVEPPAHADQSDNAAPLAERFKALLVTPETRGPRIRLGVFWFFIVLAAATSGRAWTAAVWAIVSAAAGYQIVAAWQRQKSEQLTPEESEDALHRLSSGGLFRLVAALGAGLLPLTAAYGTGTAGAALIVLPLLAVLVHVVFGLQPSAAAPTIIGIILPALAAISVVLAVRAGLWAGLFLVLAVSLYDAGSFLLGAEASSRWEGPVAGMLGVLGVTFTIATFHPPPLSSASAWVAGAAICLMCPLGQWLGSYFLPTADSAASALRRIDAYLLAAPVFLVCIWLLPS